MEIFVCAPQYLDMGTIALAIARIERETGHTIILVSDDACRDSHIEETERLAKFAQLVLPLEMPTQVDVSYPIGNASASQPWKRKKKGWNKR